MQEQSNYYYEDPRFQCCCQFCHIKKGTLAVAVASVTFASYFLIKSIAFLVRNNDDYRATTVLTFIISIAWFVVSAILLVGVLREQPFFLVPFLILQVPLIIICAALGILCVVYLAVGKAIILAPTGATDREPRTLHSYEDHLHLLILVGVQALVYGLACGFGIWFFLTAMQCYRWLKEKQGNNAERQEFTLNVMRSSRT